MKILRTLTVLTFTAITFTAIAAQQSGGAAKPAKPQTPPAGEMPRGGGAGEHDGHDHAGDMPGPVHEHMKKCVGNYTTKSTMNMPGAPAEPTMGTAKISMSLDNRFLVEESEGEMMGQPVKSMKISGYNNDAKEFESVWMYTMSTGMLHLTGTSADNGKSVTWKGTHKGADGEHAMDITTKHVDDDTFVVTMTEPDMPGMKMETTYTRTK